MLKKMLIVASVMANPNWFKIFHVHRDASNQALGSTLMQENTMRYMQVPHGLWLLCMTFTIFLFVHYFVFLLCLLAVLKESRTKKLLVQHVETIRHSEAIKDVLHSFLVGISSCFFLIYFLAYCL